MVLAAKAGICCMAIRAMGAINGLVPMRSHHRPEERQGELYEHLLRRNSKLRGMTFAIGVEDAVFLIGEIPVERISDDELDRHFGSVYTYVEQCFRPAMRIGYASRFEG